MGEQHTSQASEPVVLVVDQQRLRGAGFVALLGDWAVANGIGLRAVQPGGGVRPSGEAVRLVLLCVGGASLREPPSGAWLRETLERGGGAPVVVVADTEEVEEVVAALEAGARAYLPTNTDPAVALQALSYIMGGGSFFPPSALLKRHRPRGFRVSPNGEGSSGGSSARAQLRGQDLAVLTHLRAGRSNKAIAHLLGIPESAVKAQLRQIMRKLGVANRTQAALFGPLLAGEPANDDARRKGAPALRRVV